MKEIYQTLLYNQKQLIVKTVSGRQPFVIAECCSQEVAEQICALLNELTEKETNSQN